MKKGCVRFCIKMLQLKNLFYVQQFVIINNNKILIKLISLLYVTLNKIGVNSLFIFTFLRFIKKKLIKKIYKYIIKAETADLLFLNTGFFYLFNTFFKIKRIACGLKKKKINITKKRYTVLRAPFINKSSREQFFFSLIKTGVKVNFEECSLCLIFY
jgi:hypothetical protein